jgi:hypothetical protein
VVPRRPRRRAALLSRDRRLDRPARRPERLRRHRRRGRPALRRAVLDRRPRGPRVRRRVAHQVQRLGPRATRTARTRSPRQPSGWTRPATRSRRS